jgi:ABC-type transporter Mla maintaining outer membrane lipid asymmetry permease subunit MlaE
MSSEALIWTGVLTFTVLLGIWSPRLLAGVLFCAFIVAIFCAVGIIGIVLICALIGGLTKK